jgi:hypothetical protein
VAPSRFSLYLLGNQLQHLPLSRLRQRQPYSTISTCPDNSLTIGGRKGFFDKLFSTKDKSSTPLTSTPLSLRLSNPLVTGARHSELESRMPYEDSLAGVRLCGTQERREIFTMAADPRCLPNKGAWSVLPGTVFLLNRLNRARGVSRSRWVQQNRWRTPMTGRELVGELEDPPIPHVITLPRLDGATSDSGYSCSCACAS